VSQGQAEEAKYLLASALVQQLHDTAPKDRFTVRSVLDRLPTQSFALILLLLAIPAATPGICVLAGLLIVVVAFQMILGRSAPRFPRWIADRPLPTRHLDKVAPHVIKLLRFLEGIIYPRGPAPVEATKRVVGVAVLLLALGLVLIPFPASNLLPAFVIAVISLGYLEHDGLWLATSLAVAFGMIAIDLAVIWHIIRQWHLI
jgi:hypothetical protein